MGKLYVVGHRSFKTEKAMKGYLIRMSESGRARTTIQVYNLESTMTGDFIDKEMISNSRDLQLKSLLEDSKLGEIVELIKTKVLKDKELKQSANKYYYDNNHTIFLNKLSMVNNEKELSDVVGGQGIFLFKLEKSLDWYKTLLRARSFQSLPTGFFSKRWDSSNKKYIYENDDTIVKLFNDAKAEVLSEKKNIKKNEKKGSKKVVSSSN
jgi:hypothetical protein